MKYTFCVIIVLKKCYICIDLLKSLVRRHMLCAIKFFNIVLQIRLSLNTFDCLIINTLKCKSLIPNDLKNIKCTLVVVLRCYGD